jgi:hypothetical protein
VKIVQVKRVQNERKQEQQNTDPFQDQQTMTRIVVTLEPLDTPRDWRLLALALKRLLRAFDLRCVSIEPETEPSDQTSAN